MSTLSITFGGRSQSKVSCKKKKNQELIHRSPGFSAKDFYFEQAQNIITCATQHGMFSDEPQQRCVFTCLTEQKNC